MTQGLCLEYLSSFSLGDATDHLLGFPRLLESPGKSWIFFYKIPGPGKSWKITLVLESPGKISLKITHH